MLASPWREAAIGLTIAVAGCTLPESKDIDNAAASVTIATPGGAVHVLLACPPLPAIAPPKPAH